MVTPKLRVTPRILLVDDEAQLLELCALVMKLSGFSVVTADGPIKAISTMAQRTTGKIDLAILDYNMPVMNGCALADRLRSMSPKLKIILYSDAIDIPKSEMASVDAFIPKGEGIARLLPQIIRFARVGMWPPKAVAPNAELCFRAYNGQS